MPTNSQVRELIAPHIAGGWRPKAEKTIDITQIFDGRNVRVIDDGGIHPRPGYENSGIDFTTLSVTKFRGGVSAQSPKLLWIAYDNGTNVKIVYIDTDAETIYDTGLSLTTGYYVCMLEFEGDIYYANGVDTDGRIIVGQVATGGVVAAADNLDLKPGRGAFFGTTGTGRIQGTDVFTWGAKAGDELQSIPTSGGNAIGAAYAADVVVISTTTISPVYQTNASILEEWLASLNLAGDPEYPRVWEFSKFALASTPANFYSFSAAPAGAELVGKNSIITGLKSAHNFFYVWKKESLHSVDRNTVSITTGARVPQPMTDQFGIPNNRCHCEMNGRIAYLTTNKRLIPIEIILESGQNSPRIDAEFDRAVRPFLATIDDPGDDEWIHFNQENQLLKVGVFVDLVRQVLVYDAEIGIFYPPDTNKNFDMMIFHDNKSYAGDGSAQILFIDEIGNYDHDIPVDWFWQTGRHGIRGSAKDFQRGILRYVYLHGKMTRNSQAWVDVYKNNVFQFTKLLTDARIVVDDEGTPIGSKGYGSAGFGHGGDAPRAYEFRLPIGANKPGLDWSIVVRSDGERGDFVQCDGFILGLEPRRSYPYNHA